MTRKTRRTVLASVATAVSLGIAGCSGGGGGNDGGDGGGGDGNAGGGGSGSVTYEIDGFEVVSHSGEVSGEQYSVTAKVKNVGGQKAEMLEHDFNLKLFDADGNDITSGGNSVTAINQGEWTAGKTIEMTLTTGVDGDPSAVASYEIVIGCGSFDEGVYC